MTYTVRQAVRTNNRPNKPCEDRIATTSDTFVVADGVTQNMDEYREGMTVSPAGQAAQITAESILSVLKDAADPTAAAPEAVRLAIERTGAYNETKPSAYPAAAVYVSGAIREGRLHFSYVGDSVIMLIRRGARIRLSEQQTAHLRVYGSTKGLSITKRELYDTITNNPDSPLGYGVIFGDERALSFLRAASIALEPGDRVIFSSDGIDQYLYYAPIGELATLSPDELLDRSVRYDEAPYNRYADDKAVVVVDVQ